MKTSRELNCLLWSLHWLPQTYKLSPYSITHKNPWDQELGFISCHTHTSSLLYFLLETFSLPFLKWLTFLMHPSHLEAAHPLPPTSHTPAGKLCLKPTGWVKWFFSMFQKGYTSLPQYLTCQIAIMFSA